MNVTRFSFRFLFSLLTPRSATTYLPQLADESKQQCLEQQNNCHPSADTHIRCVCLRMCVCTRDQHALWRSLFFYCFVCHNQQTSLKRWTCACTPRPLRTQTRNLTTTVSQTLVKCVIFKYKLLLKPAVNSQHFVPYPLLQPQLLRKSNSLQMEKHDSSSHFEQSSQISERHMDQQPGITREESQHG